MSIKASDWVWGYNASVKDVEGGLEVTLSGDYGAASFGYDPEVDWSGKTLEITVKDYSNTSDSWVKVQVQNKDYLYGDSVKGLLCISKDKGGITGETVISLPIASTEDGFDATKVNQICVSGKANGDTFVITKCVLK